MDVPSSNDLVLVCLLPQVRDLEIARVLGWYRIPLKHAPKVIYTDCLAFYQPASFGKEHRWKIEYIAPVRGVELVRRNELLRDESQHPRAREEYYKISIGSLVPRAKPIAAKNWKRITFFYTTGALIQSAGTVDDLIIDNENKNLFDNTISEYRSKYADIPLAVGDTLKLEREFIAYFLNLSSMIKGQIDQLEIDLD